MSKEIEYVVNAWRSNGILNRVFERKISGKRPMGHPRQCWADSIVDDLNQCTQKVTIADSMYRDR